MSVAGTATPIRRRPLLGLVLACHPGPTAAVTAAATTYAVIVGRSVTGVVLVGAAVLLGQLTTGWQNDAIDAPVDIRSARTDKPIANGLVARITVARGAVIAAIGCAALSYGSGWRAGTVHVTAVGLAASYNAGIKRTIASVVPYVGAFALLPCFVTLGAPGAPLPPWSVPVAVALLGAAAHILNVLPDAEIDRRAGFSSLPLRLGPRSAWAASAALLVGSCALLAFGADRRSVAVDLTFAACAALGLGAVVVGSRHSRWGFRLACGVAIADVILVGVGRH